jgi:hypothetical protein
MCEVLLRVHVTVTAYTWSLTACSCSSPLLPHCFLSLQVAAHPEAEGHLWNVDIHVLATFAWRQTACSCSSSLLLHCTV